MSDLPIDGQMLWKREGDEGLALHLRHSSSEPWRSYDEFPQYFLPDPPEFSKGYATFLALLKKGWQAVST